MGIKDLSAGLILTFLTQNAKAVDPIVAKGQYLFYSTNGTQFSIKGVAYQQGIAPGGASESTNATFIDSLADAASCQRDIPYLQQLGTNTIRAYAIDPTQDHSACMNALDAAGIYVIADLSVPGESINRDDPTWTTDLFARYQGVIDNLGQYPNALGFFAGNEVTNNKTNSASSAFVKAAVRDSKAYIASKNFGKWMGVGYATNDDADTRDNLASYFNCGEDQAAAVDFWGYNIYEWCGQSTFQTSGYQERTEAFANYSVPAFFSEYGCNNPGGGEARVWQETGVLYSSLMNTVWSGGIVYEYFEEQNDFGLVSLSGTTVTPLQDFQPLATAIAQVNANASSASTLTMAAYTPSNVPRACPAVQANTWLSAETLPPTPNTTVCENMVASSACVPTDTVTSDGATMASLFGTICGLDATACTGITSNATAGVYGAYVMCTTAQQLTNAMNQYYLNQNKAQTACDFAGQAKIVTPSLAESSVSGSTTTSTTTNSDSSSSVSNSNITSETGASSSSISSTSTSTSTSASSSTTSAAMTTSSSQANAEANFTITPYQGALSGQNSAGTGRRAMVGNVEWAAGLLGGVAVMALTL